MFYLVPCPPVSVSHVYLSPCLGSVPCSIIVSVVACTLCLYFMFPELWVNKTCCLENTLCVMHFGSSTLAAGVTCIATSLTPHHPFSSFNILKTLTHLLCVGMFWHLKIVWHFILAFFVDYRNGLTWLSKCLAIALWISSLYRQLYMVVSLSWQMYLL